MTRITAIKSSDNNSEEGSEFVVTTTSDNINILEEPTAPLGSLSPKEEENETEDNSQDEDEYEYDEDDSGSRKGKKKRKSHIETKHRKTFMSIDVIAMKSCLHLNQKEAAKKLNVSLSTLKRRFYEMRNDLGCDKWPYPPHKVGGSTSTSFSSGSTTSSGNKRKHSEYSSDEEDADSSYQSSESEEMTIAEEETYQTKTRRQSITSSGNNKTRNRDLISSNYSPQVYGGELAPADSNHTNNSNSSFTNDMGSRTAIHYDTIERSNKKLKAAHTGFFSSLPEYSINVKPSTSTNQENAGDFVFYKDNYVEESSDGDQSSSSPEMMSDEEYIETNITSNASRKVKNKKKAPLCDLKEISKKTHSLENPREKEIYGAAMLLVAFKQQQIIPME